MQLTIKEFAAMHRVTIQAIRYNIKNGNIKTTTKYGQVLINDKIKYSPIRGRGNKCK